MRPARLAAALTALVAATAARAVDINDGQLSLHGDGEWAYERTSGRNAYAAGTPAGNYDTAMFDLVLTARPVEDLVISAQLGFDPDGTRLEWGFAEWRFSEKLLLRMGKVQQPFGNLNELRFAGTTRPFFHLPYAVYGPANVVGTAYLGVGVTGQVASEGGWTLAYDLYVGAVTLEEAEPYAALFRTGVDYGAKVALEEFQVRDLLGGRLSLVAPNEITLRLSGFAGQVTRAGEEEESFSSLGASLQYRGERLWLSAEAFRSEEGDSSETSWTAYASVGWMLTEHLQVAAQYERTRTTFTGSPDSPLLRHDSYGLGLAWWVNPSLVLKACWHHVDGNRFAYPVDATYGGVVGLPSGPSGPYDPSTIPSTHTDLLTVGTQFSF